MKKPVVVIAVILGLLFLVAAALYFTEPAKSLPSFLPGYSAGLNAHHYKHGIGALILGVLCFIFVWFKTGKKSGKK